MSLVWCVTDASGVLKAPQVILILSQGQEPVSNGQSTGSGVRTPGGQVNNICDFA